jgi:hypothetical protein
MMVRNPGHTLLESDEKFENAKWNCLKNLQETALFRGEKWQKALVFQEKVIANDTAEMVNNIGVP